MMVYAFMYLEDAVALSGDDERYRQMIAAAEDILTRVLGVERGRLHLDPSEAENVLQHIHSHEARAGGLTMFREWGAFVTRHPYAVLAVWLIMLIIAVPLAMTFSDRLTYSMNSFIPKDLESIQAQHIYDARFPDAAQSQLIVAIKGDPGTAVAFADRLNRTLNDGTIPDITATSYVYEIQRETLANVSPGPACRAARAVRQRVRRQPGTLQCHGRDGQRQPGPLRPAGQRDEDQRPARPRLGHGRRLQRHDVRRPVADRDDQGRACTRCRAWPTCCSACLTSTPGSGTPMPA